MPATGPDAVIWGVTHAGRRFRPSDWPDRLCGLTSVFEDRHSRSLAPLVRALEIKGSRAVLVAGGLEALEPRFWQFLLQFAADNELVVSWCEAGESPSTLDPPGPTAREPQEPV